MLLTLKKAQTELKGLMKDRVVGWIGGTYRIFEDQGKGLFKFFRRSRAKRVVKVFLPILGTELF